MVGKKKEITTLDSSTKTFISKTEKKNKNAGSTFLLSFLLLINIFTLVPTYLINSEMSYSSVSNLRTFKKISITHSSSQNYKMDIMKDQIILQEIEEKNKNQDEDQHRNSNILNSLRMNQYKIKKDEIRKTIADKGGKEDSGVVQIQNRLVHYGVYCGPGPADAFSG